MDTLYRKLTAQKGNEHHGDTRNSTERQGKACTEKNCTKRQGTPYIDYEQLKKQGTAWRHKEQHRGTRNTIIIQGDEKRDKEHPV